MAPAGHRQRRRWLRPGGGGTRRLRLCPGHVRRPRRLRSGPGGATGPAAGNGLAAVLPGPAPASPRPPGPLRPRELRAPSGSAGAAAPAMPVPGGGQRGGSRRWPGVRAWLPVLRWLPRYSPAWLQLDAMAGLSVGLAAVPQALAYAEVAGLPPQYGLYSSFMGCFVYCFLGTAKDVTLGPTAIMSLLVSSYAFHEPAYAILLAFLSGCIQLAMGFLRLGFLLDFVSCPVIKGFTSAASVTISFNQIKNILGLQGIPRQFFLQVYEILRRIGETRAGDAVLGLACLAALAGLQVMKSHLPRVAHVEPLAARVSYLIVWTSTTARNALVVLFAGLVAYSFQMMGFQPLTLTSSIPQGLPAFRLPPFSVAAPNGTVPFWSMVEDMGVGLAVVPLMGLLETVAIAKAFASQNGYRIDPNQELLAMGFANVLGSFVSAYPITGSFGRTAVNAQSGVCTPAGGLITGALVLLSLAYLTSLFYYIPKAALAAVIISAVVPMFDAGIFRTLWRVKRLDLVPLCVTFLLCFWEVQYGIVAGVLVSGVLLLYSIARPPVKVSKGDVLLVQPGSSLHFPAMECLRDAVCSHALAAASLPRSVILDCCHVSSIDYTVVVGLAELLQELRKHGLSLAFCSLQDPVLQVLLSADLEGFQHFLSREEAERCRGAEPGDGGAAPYTSTSESSLLPTGLIQ
ncbi:sodium-independent sulfate anion transporter isoform X1 [Falco biarmicus]|uniref:sodium-independent sulfate anion transporter isoform X1 n=2 Tax=Falco TaxID=8952 RepID=UPI00247A84C9|nr:sodium-independent sulfate anion transporter isoform X1 [Falco cherrug]XP_056191107.1 sodium-independent sulfate anion transporter isoform X1 [Falco biarmicus]